jgi:hypothetical protein
MPGKRYFTDEELEEMGKVTRDLILEAIDRGDLQQARELTDRMYREFLGMHDLYVYWLTATLSHVGRTFGNDALYEALRSGCDAWVTPLARRYAGKDLKTRVRMLVAGLRGHLHPLRVEEDDEKVTVYLKPCGSGGRMILNGAYKPPYDFLEIDPSQPMTFDRQKSRDVHGSPSHGSRPDAFCRGRAVVRLRARALPIHPLQTSGCHPGEGL